MDQTFDRTREIEISLRKGKIAILRYPTDEELAARERSYKTFYRKGSALPETEGQEEADEALVKKLIVGEGELDQDAAVEALGKILRAGVDEQPESEPGGYAVKLSVLYGAAKIPTIHHLKEPKVKQVRKYREAAIFWGDLKYGRQQTITSLPAVVAFYDSLFVSVEGYATSDPSAIPANHKGVVVSAVLQKIQSEEDGETIDPN